jgi:transposase InsO family protein
MSWKELTVMDQKQEFILLWKAGKHTVTALCEIFSISRSTAYKYINRYKQFGFTGLLERSRRPHRFSCKTTDVIEEEIVKLRGRHTRWGSRKILVLLEDKFPHADLPGYTTINNILKRHGMVKDRKRRGKVEPKKPIFDPQVPNEVWSADYKGKFRMGNKKYCYPLTIADSNSRFVFAAKGLHSGTAVNTKPVFIDVFRKYGLPLQIHTDNGAPFAHINSLGRLSKLSVWFMELGIQPVFSDPAHPEQNGRHERMHRELKGECTRPPCHSLQAQQRKLNKFVKEYNELRPHEALGMKTPASVHEISDRKYPETIVEWEYPKNVIEKYVTHNGAVRTGRSDWLFLTTALAAKNIGFEEIGNRIYRIFFREFFIGYADMKDRKVYDIMTYKNELKL